jgi:hypothetical protein
MWDTLIIMRFLTFSHLVIMTHAFLCGVRYFNNGHNFIYVNFFMEYSYTQRILHMNMMIYHYIMSHHFHVFVFLEGNSHDSIILPK